MESQHRRQYTRRELEAAQTLATFRLTTVVVVRNVDIIFHAAESQIQPPVENAEHDCPPPAAAANTAMGTSRGHQPITGPPNLSSSLFANANPTSVQTPVQMRGTPHATPKDQAKEPPYRYSCYLCHYISQKVGCVVNHMVNKHGLQRVQVDRTRIEASAVQMLW